MEHEALKLALEAMQINLTLLEKVEPHEDQEDLVSDSFDLTHKAIATVKEALAQPAQEPVAWQWLGSAHFRKKIPKNADITAWNPVYSAPQRPWVGLTDEEREEIALEVPMDAVCITEAKLKERNS